MSLLRNFEAVATTAIAWAVFHEHVGRRVWAGKVLIILASILVVAGGAALRLSLPGFAVLGACILWGADNNLTRELESLPATLLACIKGLFSGAFNLCLALFVFQGQGANAVQAAGALAIGALSYGASLVLFIHALRQIGSARTSTWFASGPFTGTAPSILLLHERPSPEYCCPHS